MTRFRPCIDLHGGQVKQLVGGTLGSATAALRTNHVSGLGAGDFAALYRGRGLDGGGHVVLLGPGNEEAAAAALRAWPGALHLGGGVDDASAPRWIAAGAAKVIVTSFLFPAARFSQPRLDAVLAALGGDPARLVIDLSCRRRGPDRWFVATDKWQTVTDMEINHGESRPGPPRPWGRGERGGAHRWVDWETPFSLSQIPSGSSSRTAPSS